MHYGVGQGAANSTAGRASVQASTRCTPFHIQHGQDKQLPMQNSPGWQAPAMGEEDPIAQASLDSLKPLQDILPQAHANIKAAQEKQMTHYATRQLYGEVAKKSPVHLLHLCLYEQSGYSKVGRDALTEGENPHTALSSGRDPKILRHKQSFRHKTYKHSWPAVN